MDADHLWALVARWREWARLDHYRERAFAVGKCADEIEAVIRDDESSIVSLLTDQELTVVCDVLTAELDGAPGYDRPYRESLERALAKLRALAAQGDQ